MNHRVNLKSMPPSCKQGGVVQCRIGAQVKGDQNLLVSMIFNPV